MALITGLGGVLFIALAILFAASLFLVKVPITPGHIWAPIIGLVVYLAFAVRGFERRIPTFVALLAAQVVVLILSFALSALFLDLSIDGQTYHQEAIIQLKQGWIPTYQTYQGLHAAWINHYAKGSEVFAGVIYAATQQIELGKALNPLLIVSSFFVSFAAIVKAKRVAVPTAAFFALLAALNPVSVYQAFSYYVDGPLASLLLISLALLYILFVEVRWLSLVGLAATLILLANMKFTGLVYAVLVLAGAGLLYLLWKRPYRLWPTAISAAVGLGLAGVVVGFNPYVINTWQKGHPFYPLAGTSTVNIMTTNMPADFHEKNRFEKLLVAFFARSENVTAPKETQLKVPFTVAPSELDIFFIPDTRIGGFGPLFGGALLLWLGLAIALGFGKVPGLAFLGASIALLVGSSVINPEAWWARYAPQLWLVPLITCLVAWSSQRRWAKAASALLLLVLAANVALVSKSYVVHQHSSNGYLKDQLARFKAHGVPVVVDFNDTMSNRLRLQAFGIPFIEDPEHTCPTSVSLLYSTTKVCLQPHPEAFVSTLGAGR